MTIRLDVSRETAVALCTRCPDWRELRASRAAAWAAGAQHEAAAHPGDRQAYQALTMLQRRMR